MTTNDSEPISEYYYLKGMNEEKPAEEKKTAEETDERLLIKRIWSRAYLDTEESHVQLIREYAAQETAALREENERLKEGLKNLRDLLVGCEQRGIDKEKILTAQLKEALKELIKIASIVVKEDIHGLRKGQIINTIENAKKLTGQ